MVEAIRLTPAQIAAIERELTSGNRVEACAGQRRRESLPSAPERNQREYRIPGVSVRREGPSVVNL